MEMDFEEALRKDLEMKSTEYYKRMKEKRAKLNQDNQKSKEETKNLDSESQNNPTRER